MSALRTKIIRGAHRAAQVVDDVASIVSPTWAARREYVRQARKVRARYDGGTSGRRSSSWLSRDGSANAQIAPFVRVLRSRARDLVRNNEYARRAKTIYQSNVIGTGIRPVYKENDELNLLLRQYIGGGDNGIWKPLPDAEMRKSLFSMQRLAEGERIESGEMFIKREWRTRRQMDEMGLPVPFQMRCLEPEFLDETIDGEQPNGNFAVRGVEVDGFGRIVAYHFYEEHPYGHLGSGSLKSQRVDAEDVIHIYDEERAGQVRGVTRYAPVMLKMRDYSQYEDVQLVRQKIAASFVALLRRPHGGAKVTADGHSENEMQIKPGMIRELPPGYDVEFGRPPGVDGFKDFSQVTLHSIATGLDVTYEQLTSDYSEVSFISGRMGRIEFDLMVDVLQQEVWGPKFCWKFDRWFREGAAMVGVRNALDGGGIRADRARWNTPNRKMLDPGAETTAITRKVRSGINSWQDEVRQTGRDPDEVLREYAEDVERFEEHGLIFDIDPRVRTQAGNPIEIGE